jgi:hypothetical protein
MTTEEKTLTEDEQFAALTAGNPLFGQPKNSGDDAGKQEPGADAGAAGEAATAAGGDTAGAASGADDQRGAGQGDQGAAAQGAVGGGDAGAAGAAASGEEPFPGYNDMPAPAREAYDKAVQDRRKYENDYKALHGMTAPLQRGNAELRRQLESQQARIQQLEQLERKHVDVSAAKDQALQEFDEWAKQYPEESKALLALVNPLRDKVATLEGSLTAARAELGTLHAERQQAALDREVGELEKIHPDWRSIYHSQDYWDWLSAQPPGIQGLNSSMFAGDTIQLLSLFKGNRPRAESTAAAAPAAAAPGVADAVQQRRSQALKQGTQPAIRATESAVRKAGSQGDMTDEDAQFYALVANNPNFK